ncbi:hypothetical protein KY285_000258 [Solanum tuberosum]|nr:hypothetical protein KY284_000295 [Solanum tuberosum]KAH0764387.1 hypothetical protein KY285_000258 [Solanum tuberosum]
MLVSPRTLSNTACLDGESRNNASYTKAFLSSSDYFGRDEESHGDLQQPSMDVDSPSATNKLPAPRVIVL